MNKAVPLGIATLGPLLFVFLILAPLALAITDDFRVQTLIDADTTPPTVPTNLIAVPVATSQINLSWDSSTDDTLLGGYLVWRDDVFIATTTLTEYEDTGLSASTTYAYYVTAFDSSFNSSASSSVVSTTTLSIPEPSDEGEGPIYGTRITPIEEQLLTLEILTQKDSAVVRHETKGHIRSVIRWGRTSSYELGSVAEQAFSRRHETHIPGLIPGMTYHYIIEGENGIGMRGIMHRGVFTTLPPEDTFPPGNVTELTAVKEGNDVMLSWVNPRDPDLEKVRVMRSDRFYPTDVADGWVVYEGKDTAYRDEGRAEGDGWLYYTVFTYDELGNISSGAVVSIYIGAGEEPTPPHEVDPTQNEILLTFDDVAFIQEGVEAMREGDFVTIDGAKQLTISIPYDRLPEHLKTILVVIRESEESEKSFKFLLRVNEGKTDYTGTLAPFGRSGRLPVQVSVFDFKTAQVGYANGTIISRIQSMGTPVALGFLETVMLLGGGYINALWFLLLLVILMFVGTRMLSREF